MRTVRSSGRTPKSVCPGGVSASSAWWDTPLPVDRMTDACENLTLPQLRFGR